MAGEITKSNGISNPNTTASSDTKGIRGIAATPTTPQEISHNIQAKAEGDDFTGVGAYIRKISDNTGLTSLASNIGEFLGITAKPTAQPKDRKLQFENRSTSKTKSITSTTSDTPTDTVTRTFTSTVTTSSSRTPTYTPTISRTATITPSPKSPSPSADVSVTPSISDSPAKSITGSASPTKTPSYSISHTSSPSSTKSITPSATPIRDDETMIKVRENGTDTVYNRVLGSDWFISNDIIPSIGGGKHILPVNSFNSTITDPPIVNSTTGDITGFEETFEITTYSGSSLPKGRYFITKDFLLKRRTTNSKGQPSIEEVLDCECNLVDRDSGCCYYVNNTGHVAFNTTVVAKNKEQLRLEPSVPNTSSASSATISKIPLLGTLIAAAWTLLNYRGEDKHYNTTLDQPSSKPSSRTDTSDFFKGTLVADAPKMIQPKSIGNFGTTQLPGGRGSQH